VGAHGNSLRALVKHIDNMSEKDILHFNIPTGIPLIYDLDDQLSPRGREYLADSEQLSSAIDEIKNQVIQKKIQTKELVSAILRRVPPLPLHYLPGAAHGPFMKDANRYKTLLSDVLSSLYNCNCCGNPPRSSAGLFLGLSYSLRNPC